MALDPDEILLDARNLPAFDRERLEGQIEQPLPKRNFYLLAGVIFLTSLVFFGRAGWLMAIRGSALAARARDNTVTIRLIPAPRGEIFDRRKEPLAWSKDGERDYITAGGFAHLLGYLGYPNKEEMTARGLEAKELVGQTGVESVFDESLRGQPGLQIEEHNAAGEIISHHLQEKPIAGEDFSLSVDARIQSTLFAALGRQIEEQKFQGGAAVVMDVRSGEILALTSYPEFIPAKLLPGTSSVELLQTWQTDRRKPFLNRAVGGLYSPGSTVKTIVATAALVEGLITPEKKILSTGSISVPNPYDPNRPTIFRDWKAHGWVDMRQALAWSSDVYFYEVGGGYPGQPGLGIERLDKYFKLFGLGQKTGLGLPGEATGTIPTPEWKAKNFPDDPIWRIGNTYHTAIGQYGVQVTPIQMVRVAGAIANDGYLLVPVILKQATSTVALSSRLPIPASYLAIVREGMRQAVTDGLSQALNTTLVELAVKTGTAEIGVSKKTVNSWAIGFWPYQTPHYAIAVVMEAGPISHSSGAAFVFSRLIQTLAQIAPEYLQ